MQTKTVKVMSTMMFYHNRDDTHLKSLDLFGLSWYFSKTVITFLQQAC